MTHPARWIFQTYIIFKQYNMIGSPVGYYLPFTLVTGIIKGWGHRVSTKLQDCQIEGGRFYAIGTLSLSCCLRSGIIDNKQDSRYIASFSNSRTHPCFDNRADPLASSTGKRTLEHLKDLILAKILSDPNSAVLICSSKVQSDWRPLFLDHQQQRLSDLIMMSLSVPSRRGANSA